MTFSGRTVNSEILRTTSKMEQRNFTGIFTNELEKELLEWPQATIFLLTDRSIMVGFAHPNCFSEFRNQHQEYPDQWSTLVSAYQNQRNGVHVQSKGRAIPNKTSDTQKASTYIASLYDPYTILPSPNSCWVWCWMTFEFEVEFNFEFEFEFSNSSRSDQTIRHHHLQEEQRSVSPCMQSAVRNSWPGVEIVAWQWACPRASPARLD